MTKDLKLSCYELLIYGVIYSSQNQTYVRWQNYLAEITGMSIATTKRYLKKMVDNNLIQKVSHWYQIVSQWYQKVSDWYEKVSEWYQEENTEIEKYQSDTKKVSEWATYIYTRNNNIKENIKEKDEDIVIEKKETKEKKVKNRHLDFVLLTDDEYNKLIEKYWKWVTERKIEDLNNYIGSKWKKYKSHYFTILEWLRKDKVKPLEKKPVETQTNEHLQSDTRASWLKQAFPLNK